MMLFENISSEVKAKLWQHQVEALDFAINHLNTLTSPCLIRMPTGTGKTGVIACLTKIANSGSSLILTPWAHLRDQMMEDIEREFWKKVKIISKEHEVVSLFPSTASEILKSPDPMIIVSTFTTLTDLHINQIDTYTMLANKISLVIVDEGHYEPAVNWGKSVKELKIKTVLLTATPYRNDLKLFRITDPKKSTHHFTHKEALEKEIIRELSFDELDAPINIRSLSLEFVRKWNNAKQSNLLPSLTPKAIICCSSSAEIEETVNHLREAGIKAVGIHHRFKLNSNPYLLKNVPNPQDNDSEIWVHQNKLTEGIDDHRFCCVALFTRIHNDRKLIQQIGRILRRNINDQKTPSLLLAPSKFSDEPQWKAYLDFENDLQLLDPQHYRDVVEKILDLQPKTEYFNGRFRKRFSPIDLNNMSQVIINPSVLVRIAHKSFSLEKYIEECTDTLNIEDAVILGEDLNAPCQKSESFALWVY
ncbi:MAG: DEAD/DEAH box helicase, partial [Alphaproteobacteria bacterium]